MYGDSELWFVDFTRLTDELHLEHISTIERSNLVKGVLYQPDTVADVYIVYDKGAELFVYDITSRQPMEL